LAALAEGFILTLLSITQITILSTGGKFHYALLTVSSLNLLFCQPPQLVLSREEILPKIIPPKLITNAGVCAYNSRKTLT
jgi:hypothetical protein